MQAADEQERLAHGPRALGNRAVAFKRLIFANWLRERAESTDKASWGYRCQCCGSADLASATGICLACGYDVMDYYDDMPEMAAASHAACTKSTDSRCSLCGGLNGTHGLVHVRHGNGGGHNAPCPQSTDSEVGR